MPDDFERRPDHPLTIQRAIHAACMSETPKVMNHLVGWDLAAVPKTQSEYWALHGLVLGELKKAYPQAVLARAKEAQ